MHVKTPNYDCDVVALKAVIPWGGIPGCNQARVGEIRIDNAKLSLSRQGEWSTIRRAWDWHNQNKWYSDYFLIIVYI